MRPPATHEARMNLKTIAMTIFVGLAAVAAGANAAGDCDCCNPCPCGTACDCP